MEHQCDKYLFVKIWFVFIGTLIVESFISHVSQYSFSFIRTSNIRFSLIQPAHIKTIPPFPYQDFQYLETKVSFEAPSALVQLPSDLSYCDREAAEFPLHLQEEVPKGQIKFWISLLVGKRSRKAPFLGHALESLWASAF